MAPWQPAAQLQLGRFLSSRTILLSNSVAKARYFNDLSPFPLLVTTRPVVPPSSSEGSLLGLAKWKSNDMETDKASMNLGVVNKAAMNRSRDAADHVAASFERPKTTFPHCTSSFPKVDPSSALLPRRIFSAGSSCSHAFRFNKLANSHSSLRPTPPTLQVILSSNVMSIQHCPRSFSSSVVLSGAKGNLTQVERLKGLEDRMSTEEWNIKATGIHLQELQQRLKEQQLAFTNYTEFSERRFFESIAEVARQVHLLEAECKVHGKRLDDFKVTVDKADRRFWIIAKGYWEVDTFRREWTEDRLLNNPNMTDEERALTLKRLEASPLFSVVPFLEFFFSRPESKVKSILLTNSAPSSASTTTTSSTPSSSASKQTIVQPNASSSSPATSIAPTQTSDPPAEVPTVASSMMEKVPSNVVVSSEASRPSSL
ncbi:hypothetical protein BJ508DRAFT_313807 [Ascobolus immersus RN42]|uniref:Uncharacterized protein n=1 Tax=Ascobolus immersus RN42 TaxID=1160509 RepID=A0A3N4HNQ2_ASCIM|nr:hypothetical protein BJ508DRAFT_313807 [Ascobolus immersus RN42]